MDLDRLAEIMAASFGRIEQRFDALDQRMDRLEQRMDRLEQRMDRLEQRMDGLEQRMDGLEQRMDGLEQRMDRMHAEMIERFQSMNDRFASADLRFDQVNTRLEHRAFRQDMLEEQFDPFPKMVQDLEKSMRTGFADILKQLERVQVQVVVVNERLDTISDEMRQRFRAVNERLS